MAGFNTLWDARANSQDVEAVSRLSRMVAGNDHLVTEPGLVQALFENNASPQQAQALNQFIGGLHAEQLVRTASAAGTTINLSDDEQSALTAMGVKYDSVVQTPKDAVTSLTEQMAAKGLQPVLDDSGQVRTDAEGNPLAETKEQAVVDKARAKFIHQAQHQAGWFDNPLSFANHLGDALKTGGNAVLTKAQQGYNWITYTVQSSTDPSQAALRSAANTSLMERLGYDPKSWFSEQAFIASGHMHNDTSHIQKAWDKAHPTGLYGWDGKQAVLEAEVFAADPGKYVKAITANQDLTPTDAAAKLAAVSSDQFQNLVKRVGGASSGVGAEVASGLGIDPVAHATTFTAVSTGANLAAQFALDPLAMGMSIAREAQVASVAIKSLTDGGGISRILKPAEGVGTSMAQRRVITSLNDMVEQTAKLRAATEAGDTVAAARVNAAIQTNPFGALAGDFLGHDQIVGVKAEHSVLDSKSGDLPFVFGQGKPITTYDEAVDYLASKSALLRLQGGYAPVETSVMPGAMSSYAYSRLKGSLQSWSAGRTAKKSVAAGEKFAATIKNDPGRLTAMLDDGLLIRTMPGDDDAVDMLSGKVLAAQRAVHAAASPEEAADATTGLASARRALGDAVAQSSAPVLVDDAIRGTLRGNQLRYGLSAAPKSALGKVASIYTLGTAQRARVFVTRFTNWLPRDTQIDLTSSASADTVRKIARTYLTPGDANMLSVRWITGNADTRKAIVGGLKDQIGHAAGLSRTKAGRELMDKWKSETEAYSTFGREFTDSNGIPAAQWPGQVQTKFALPNFGAVHKAAAKIGLYEGTMGRLLGSTPVEKLLVQWKLGALFTPVTAMRANLEAWLNGAAEGMFKDGLRGKALLRETGKLDGADLARGRVTDKILSLAPLQGAGRIYRHVMLRGLDTDVAKAITEMPDDILHSAIHQQAATHFAMNVDPGGVSEATAIARNGFRPVRAQYDTKDGFASVVSHRKGYEVTDEVDGVAGANLYAHNLALRVNKAPNVAKAIIERIEDPTLAAGHVVAALESGASKQLMRHSLFGKIYFTPDGKQVNAVTADEIALGKQQWADQITKEFEQLVTGRNGVVQKKITEHIATTGKAPNADWVLDNVKKLNRPAALLKPVIHATPAEGGVKGLVDNLLDAEGKGYQWLVERLIQRHSTSPLFAAAYGRAKVGLEDFKQGLVTHSGLSEEAAERATATIAADHAWARIARMVDDPNLKSQMDIVGRSFFAFSRATTTMLRRWGGTFWRNPAQARRLQLSLEAAHHSGLIYSDPTTGDWMFHFPASGVAQEVLMHAMSHVPGLDGLAQFPVSDFTGRVASIVPGSSNPFQYATNPIVSIAGRTIASKFPEHRELFDEVDRKLNGDAGQGQGIFATLTPSIVKKLTDPMRNDRDSITTSAMVGSLYNLYAAGLVPPDGASPAELEEFMGRLKTQTKTQLYLRAILGAFSPATIGLPENENSASRPDLAYAIRGAQGLRDEYKMLLNDSGGDVARATAIWTALHPDLTVYTQSGSHATTSKATMPATQAALDWMNKNQDFIGKYKSVAAFFIPEQSAGDPYSQAAYRAQLEEGLRQRKTPQEFLDGARVSAAASVYYPMKDKYDADLAAAKAAGNDQLAAQHRADWEAWSKQFKALHPSFAAHNEGSAANIVVAEGQLADLRSMVQANAVPGGSRVKAAVTGMVQAYDGYKAFIASHPGGTNEATASRQAALAQFQDYLSQVVSAVPDVKDLYAGVFRTLNSNLETIE